MIFSPMTMIRTHSLCTMMISERSLSNPGAGPVLKKKHADRARRARRKKNKPIIRTRVSLYIYIYVFDGFVTPLSGGNARLFLTTHFVVSVKRVYIPKRIIHTNHKLLWAVSA